MATSVEVTPKTRHRNPAVHQRRVRGCDRRRALQVLNPHDGSLLCEISEAGTKDVDRAVAAARKALPAWKKLLASERGRLIFKLADAIEADREYLCRLETLDTGHPIRDTYNLDVFAHRSHVPLYGGNRR